MPRATRSGIIKQEKPAASDGGVDLDPSRSYTRSKFTTFVDDEAQTKYELFSGYDFLPSRIIDWGALKVLGIEREVREMFKAAGMEGFLKINESAYRELTLEFLATFKYNPEIKSFTDRDRYKFRMMGMDMSMSLNTFNEFLGCVSFNELGTESYQNSLVDFPPEFNAAEYWKDLTGEDSYRSGDSKSSLIPYHPLRFMQKYLATTLFSRRSQSNCPTNDLFVLWAMTTHRRINVAHWLGLHMSLISNRSSNAILCGPFITKLGKSLGVILPVLHHLTLEVKMEKFDCNALSRLDICRKAGKTWKLFGTTDMPAAKKAKTNLDFDDLDVMQAMAPDPQRRLFHPDEIAFPAPGDVTMSQLLQLLGLSFKRIKELEADVQMLKKNKGSAGPSTSRLVDLEQVDESHQTTPLLRGTLNLNDEDIADGDTAKLSDFDNAVKAEIAKRAQIVPDSPAA
ncbi:hypothetical protein M5689_023133 [Euphorbia peplus]|nr:hypothetical protein M5689_023133 [Euphorbia peplus]